MSSYLPLIPVHRLRKYYLANINLHIDSMQSTVVVLSEDLRNA